MAISTHLHNIFSTSITAIQSKIRALHEMSRKSDKLTTQESS